MQQHPKGWNFAQNMFFSQVALQPCAIIPSPAADPMVHFTPSSFQSAAAGLGCQYVKLLGTELISQPHSCLTWQKVDLLHGILQNRQQVIFTGQCSPSQAWRTSVRTVLPHRETSWPWTLQLQPGLHPMAFSCLILHTHWTCKRYYFFLR